MSRIVTPPSLVWLIKQRIRLLQELEFIETLDASNLEKQTVMLKKLESECRALKSYIKDFEVIKIRAKKDVELQLDAVTTALGMHEIQIDIDLVKPKKSSYRLKKDTYRNEYYLPHGLLSKSIYECLKFKGIASREEITNYVISRANIENNPKSFAVISEAVRSRLKNLRMQSKVEELSEGLFGKHKRFRLKNTYFPRQINMINSLS